MTEKEKNLNDTSQSTSIIKSSESFYNNSYHYIESPSSIEILTINEDNGIIEFKCLKEDREEIKTMLIKDFLEKKEKYTKKIIKDEKCKIHSSYDNNYISYCFDCKIHLCKECLKSRIHINHNKNYLIEIQPTEDELSLIEEVTKSYKKTIENLEQEKIIKMNQLEESLNLKIYIEDKILKKKLVRNSDNMEKKLIESKNGFLNDIKEIKKRYENEINLRKINYEKEKNEIINKYKLINDKESVINKLNIEKINKKYKEELNSLPFDKKIENMDNIIKINEFVYNDYNNSKNNYYNALNINNLLLFFCKNDYISNKIMKNFLKNNFENVLKLILTKNNEDINLNLRNEFKEKERKNIIEKEIDIKIKELNEENEQKINDLIEEKEQSINELKEEHEKTIEDINEENEKKINTIKKEKENEINILKEEKNKKIKKIKAKTEQTITKLKNQNDQKIEEILQKGKESMITLIKEVIQYFLIYNIFIYLYSKYLLYFNKLF